MCRQRRRPWQATTIITSVQFGPCLGHHCFSLSCAPKHSSVFFFFFQPLATQSESGKAKLALVKHGHSSNPLCTSTATACAGGRSRLPQLLMIPLLDIDPSPSGHSGLSCADKYSPRLTTRLNHRRRAPSLPCNSNGAAKYHGSQTREHWHLCHSLVQTELCARDSEYNIYIPTAAALGLVQVGE
ncbi:hypothetical protein BC827DRAFT_1207545 [Russula dissimulans]|nr:hypothetical protein BC827DRAFT_1207545 [Russula dissimulans]